MSNATTRIYPALRHCTYTKAQLLDDDAIKTAIATDNTQANTYSAAALNGALANPGPAVMRFPQAFYITTSAAALAYNPNSPIVATGTDYFGETVTESFTLDTNGNELLVGDVGFMSITSIRVPQQLLNTGQFKFGVRDVVFSEKVMARQIRHGSAGNVYVAFSNDVVDTVPGLLGERHDAFYKRIYGTAATTSDPVTIYL